MIKHSAAFLLTLATMLCCSCGNTNEQKNNDKDTAAVVATGKPDTTAAPAETKSPEEMQLSAQDTLFEDGSTPSSWKDAGFNDSQAFKKFLVQFKDWVKTDNIDSISSHIKFPIKAAKNATVFKTDYSKLFTADLKNVVAGQRLDRIFRNYQGAMLGDGKLWFAELKGNYFITAINK